ncbi:hypothetical protein SUGI_0697130, partial [Cryptomeria japonica]
MIPRFVIPDTAKDSEDLPGEEDCLYAHDNFELESLSPLTSMSKLRFWHKQAGCWQRLLYLALHLPIAFANFNRSIYHCTSQWGARSEALATITKNMFEASEWMNSLSRGSKNAYEMLKSTKFHNVTSTAAEICAVMGRTHWAGAGFLVLAAIISRIHNAQGVDKKCLELLKSINMVGKTLARFTRLPLIPEEMKSTVNEARNLTARSAACCLSIIDSSRFSKFMSSKKNDELVSQCCKQLERLQREITFQVSIISFTERHEVSSVFSKKRKHAEASQTKESTSHGDDSTIANDQGKPK